MLAQNANGDPDLAAEAGQKRERDTARRVTERLANREPSSKPDPESSFAALTAPRRRVAETIEGVLSADRAAIDKRQDDNFTVNIGQDIPFTGRSYALAFGVPNVLFRVSMAYGIMRHNGVQLGKVDYIAPFLSA